MFFPLLHLRSLLSAPWNLLVVLRARQSGADQQCKGVTQRSRLVTARLRIGTDCSTRTLHNHHTHARPTDPRAPIARNESRPLHPRSRLIRILPMSSSSLAPLDGERVHAGSSEAAIRETLRRCLTRGIPLDPMPVRKQAHTARREARGCMGEVRVKPRSSELTLARC